MLIDELHLFSVPLITSIKVDRTTSPNGSAGIVVKKTLYTYWNHQKPTFFGLVFLQDYKYPLYHIFKDSLIVRATWVFLTSDRSGIGKDIERWISASPSQRDIVDASKQKLVKWWMNCSAIAGLVASVLSMYLSWQIRGFLRWESTKDEKVQKTTPENFKQY